MNKIANRSVRAFTAAAIILAASMPMAFVVPAALAVEPHEMLPDPAMEARAREISKELRCLVCQNQAIDDSNAPLARDLRVLLRERLSAGDSDAQAMQFLVDRYGDYVLLKPPFKKETLLLWLSPVILILGGIVLARTQFRRTSKGNSTKPLSAEEQAAVDELLNADRKGA